ncbi:MAG TPA: glutaredoxin 3 [Myxococcaceae bacterium]|jgi:glutaredoxin 3
MADVFMYMKPTCGYCQRAMSLLRQKGVKFDMVDISAHPERRQEMIQRSNGRTTVPEIFINGRHIGGCDDLMALDSSGRLDPMLAEQASSTSP